MEMPTVANFSNTLTSYNPCDFTHRGDTCTSAGFTYVQDKESAKRLAHFQQVKGSDFSFSSAIKNEEEDMSEISKRIVVVFIVDPNENIGLDHAILYRSKEELTDSTDQELFMGIGIKEILDRHNEVRVKTVDKKATAKAGKDIFLEAARIRDLKMVVSTIAEF